MVPMRWILLSTILFTGISSQDSPQQDPMPIYRLIFESLSNETAGRTVLLDRRILELHDGSNSPVFHQQHNISHVQALISEKLVDDICVPIFRPSTPVEKWTCQGSTRTIAISLGELQYQEENLAECLVLRDYHRIHTRRAISDSTEYLHIVSFEKFQFRLDENSWVVEDQIGILDVHGPAPPPYNATR
jgi:hypothetical protein